MQSSKKDDPLKVGRFGIGFNSVYHVTGKWKSWRNVSLEDREPKLNSCFVGLSIGFKVGCCSSCVVLIGRVICEGGANQFPLT